MTHPPTITPAMEAVARMSAAGLPAAEIARRRGVSRKTIHAQLCDARRRLGIAADRRLLAQALASCVVHADKGGRPSGRGLQAGDAVRMTGGRFQGLTGRYVGGNNTTQVLVRIGGGVFALRARFVERIG